jgi:thymidine phosphorylase
MNTVLMKLSGRAFGHPRGTLDRLDGTVMVRRSAADRARTGSTADELPVASYETFTSTEVLGGMAIPD